MKPFQVSKFLILILVFVFCSTCFGSIGGVNNLDKALKSFSTSDAENSCFIIGSFKMVHTKLDYAPSSVTGAEDINGYCICKLIVSLESTDTHKVYPLLFKAVSGSNYSKANFEANEKDPYWVVQAPPGNYELTTTTFHLVIDQSGYYHFDQDVVTVPLSRDIKKSISFTTRPKQIMYIGDYNADFKTNVLQLQVTRLFPYNQFKITLTDNFEKTKATVFERANDKTKEKLKSFEFVSAL